MLARQTWLPPQGHLHFAGEGGRATSADWSYFNLGGPNRFDRAWHGQRQWAADFVPHTTNGLSLRAGQELTRLVSASRREIEHHSSPAVLAARDWIDAQNILRRWMLQIQCSLGQEASRVERCDGSPAALTSFGEMQSMPTSKTNINVHRPVTWERALKLDYGGWMRMGILARVMARTGTWEVDPKRISARISDPSATTPIRKE